MLQKKPINPSPATIMIKEPDIETSIADSPEPKRYNSNNALPPNLRSAQPDGMAPTPNIKALMVTTSPRVSNPILNSFRKMGIRLGNASIRAWTDK